MPPQEILVVAIGGNAIIGPGQIGTIYEQFANTRKMIDGIVELIERGYRVVMTHGNGPQAGQMLIRVEEAYPRIPDLPLGVIVADIQGQMGYMIQQSMMNKLWEKGMQRPVAMVLTQMIISPDDPHMKNPTKPIGPFYSLDQAKNFTRDRGWRLIEDAGRGYRRVVPSPRPIRIVERKTIKCLIEHDHIVIAAGGGGIPVYLLENKKLEGVDAVIDKDLASAILARDIEADFLLILTNVPQVYLHYNTPDQRPVERCTVSAVRRYIAEGHFPEGSMLPKMEAAVQFLECCGKATIITDHVNAVQAMQGRAGTWIVPDET